MGIDASNLQPQQFQVRDITTSDLLSKHWDTQAVGTPDQMRSYDSGYLNNVLKPKIQQSGNIDPLEMRGGVLDDGHHRALVGHDIGVQSMTVHDYGSQPRPAASLNTRQFQGPSAQDLAQSQGLDGIEDVLRGMSI